LNTSVWEFAIELRCLHRLNVSNSDLRWLVATGLISHSIETTSPSDAERHFKQPARLILCRTTCFVLTPEGAALGRAVWDFDAPSTAAEGIFLRPESTSLSLAPPLRPLVPTWDRVRQELRVGSIIVKRYRVPASSQEAILAAFEEESWPPRIDDPLPPRSDQSPKRRLQETIKSLNRNQKNQLIRFLGDGTAQGVLWEYCGEHDAPKLLVGRPVQLPTAV
jgi:hypothetical protein